MPPHSPLLSPSSKHAPKRGLGFLGMGAPRKEDKLLIEIKDPSVKKALQSTLPDTNLITFEGDKLHIKCDLLTLERDYQAFKQALYTALGPTITSDKAFVERYAVPSYRNAYAFDEPNFRIILDKKQGTLNGRPIDGDVTGVANYLLNALKEDSAKIPEKTPYVMSKNDKDVLVFEVRDLNFLELGERYPLFKQTAILQHEGSTYMSADDFVTAFGTARYRIQFYEEERKLVRNAMLDAFVATTPGKAPKLIPNTEIDLSDNVNADFLKQEVLSKVQAVNGKEEIIKEEPVGIIFSEKHSVNTQKSWLVANMKAFKATGGTHLFLEHFSQEQQQDINAYLEGKLQIDLTKKENLNPLELYLKRREGENTPNDAKDLLALLQAAREAQVQIVGIDTDIAKPFHDKAKEPKLWQRDRAFKMNGFAKQTIEGIRSKGTLGNYVVLIGEKHESMHEGGIPGLAQLLNNIVVVKFKGEPQERPHVAKRAEGQDQQFLTNLYSDLRASLRRQNLFIDSFTKAFKSHKVLQKELAQLSEEQQSRIWSEIETAAAFLAHKHETQLEKLTDNGIKSLARAGAFWSYSHVKSVRKEDTALSLTKELIVQGVVEGLSSPVAKAVKNFFKGKWGEMSTHLETTDKQKYRNWTAESIFTLGTERKDRKEELDKYGPVHSQTFPSAAEILEQIPDEHAVKKDHLKHQEAQSPAEKEDLAHQKAIWEKRKAWGTAKKEEPAPDKGPKKKKVKPEKKPAEDEEKRTAILKDLALESLRGGLSASLTHSIEILATDWGVEPFPLIKKVADHADAIRDEIKRHNLKPYLDEGIYGGIGIMGRFDAAAGVFRIEEVFEGTPAEALGLKKGDAIAVVFDASKGEWISLDGCRNEKEALQLIRGEVGTEIALEYLRGNQSFRTDSKDRDAIDAAHHCLYSYEAELNRERVKEQVKSVLKSPEMEKIINAMSGELNAELIQGLKELKQVYMPTPDKPAGKYGGVDEANVKAVRKALKNAVSEIKEATGTLKIDENFIKKVHQEHQKQKEGMSH